MSDAQSIFGFSKGLAGFCSCTEIGFSDFLSGTVTGTETGYLDFSNRLTGLLMSCPFLWYELTGCGISTGSTCPGNSSALTCLAKVGVAVVLDISTDTVLDLVS